METNIMKFHIYDVTNPFLDGRDQGVTNVRIFKNYWWLCVDGDPTKALFYSQFYNPQCNSNKAIMEHKYTTVTGEQITQGDRIGKQIKAEVKLVQIPLAYAPYKD